MFEVLLFSLTFLCSFRLGVRFVFHEGERSEPEWNTKRDPMRLSSVPTLDCDVAFDILRFLLSQENETDALLQKNVGGVRKLVQPLDGVKISPKPSQSCAHPVLRTRTVARAAATTASSYK